MSDPKEITAQQRSFLETELALWVEQGLLGSEQQEQILARYVTPEAPARRQRSVSGILPAILIGLAVLLIGVGLSLFYAANWRKMPPELRLVQVFGLLLLTYGGGYALLFRRRPFELAGRGLMLLGMLVYGAAIGLVAQIYHISAHPTHGVLLWLVGVLLLSAVMQERWGYYLAALLALVWNTWECFEYGSPNYPFVALAVVIGYLFHRKGDRAGILVAALEILVWFYQVNILWVSRAVSQEAALFALLFLHIPLGAALVAWRQATRDPLLRPVAAVLGAAGWVFIYAPLVALSWPMDPGFGRYSLLPGILPFSAQHVLFTGAGLLLILILRRRQKRCWLPLVCLACGILAPLLPVGSRPVLLVFTHLGLLGLALGLLHSSHQPGSPSADRALAFTLTIITLAVKGVGLLFLALTHREFYVAYGLGFIILATVMLLINEYVSVLHDGRGKAPVFQAGLLRVLCTLSIFLMLYALAFRVPEQASILRIDPVVLLLLATLILVACLLYGLLWRRTPHRLPLGLSGFVFALSVLLLLLGGPHLSWRVYAILFNLLLFAFEGALLYHSTRINSTVLANLVIFAFVLQVATRYFDIFWDLLSGSLLFICTGVLVFGGGFFLEWNRRRLIRHIQASGAASPPVEEDRQ